MAKKKQTQHEMVINHLKKHLTITPIQSLSLYGCYRLSEVIRKLRKKGYDIKTIKTPVKSKFGKKIFGTYKLIK